MYNEDTELLFPPRVIPTLRNLKGQPWIELVDQILAQDLTSFDRLAFVLMMVRLGGCTTCHSDSFRAMRGCTHCAGQTIRRYRGDDQDLLRSFEEAKVELERCLKKRPDLVSHPLSPSNNI